MLSKPLLAFVTASSLVGIGQLFDSPALAGQSNFYCDTNGDVPITKVRTPRGEEEFIRWKNSYANGFSPAKRCQLVTARLQTQTARGRWFITSRENVNGMPVLCAVSREGENCNASSILVTLKRGADIKTALQEFNSFRSGASNQPIELSGAQQQQQYMTSVDGSDYINFGQAVADRTGLSVEEIVAPTNTADEESPTNNAPTGARF